MAAAATSVLVCGSEAYAASEVQGITLDLPDVLSGNTLELPSDLPVNVCDNAVAVHQAASPRGCAHRSTSSAPAGEKPSTDGATTHRTEEHVPVASPHRTPVASTPAEPPSQRPTTTTGSGPDTPAAPTPTVPSSRTAAPATAPRPARSGSSLPPSPRTPASSTAPLASLPLAPALSEVKIPSTPLVAADSPAAGTPQGPTSSALLTHTLPAVQLPSAPLPPPLSASTPDARGSQAAPRMAPPKRATHPLSPATVLPSAVDVEPVGHIATPITPSFPPPPDHSTTPASSQPTYPGPKTPAATPPAPMSPLASVQASAPEPVRQSHFASPVATVSVTAPRTYARQTSHQVTAAPTAPLTPGHAPAAQAVVAPILPATPIAPVASHRRPSAQAPATPPTHTVGMASTGTEILVSGSAITAALLTGGVILYRRGRSAARR